METWEDNTSYRLFDKFITNSSCFMGISQLYYYITWIMIMFLIIALLSLEVKRKGVKMFRLISNREYDELYDTIERKNNVIARLERSNKYKEEIIATIQRIIAKSKQTQNYNSVINTLNKIETQIKKLVGG